MAAALELHCVRAARVPAAAAHALAARVSILHSRVGDAAAREAAAAAECPRLSEERASLAQRLSAAEAKMLLLRPPSLMVGGDAG
jgi:hypothetical protein